MTLNFLYISETNAIQKPVEVVIQDESKLTDLGYCLPATSRNVEWNWTKPGETAILPCPLGNIRTLLELSAHMSLQVVPFFPRGNYFLLN